MNGKIVSPKGDRDERLAQGDIPPPISLEMGMRLARLAFKISNRFNNHNAHDRERRWEDLPPLTQQQACAGAIRVVQAMVVIGLIEDSRNLKVIG